MIVCQQTGKEGFETKAGARERLKSLSQRDGYRGKPYRCPYCALFHVGRPQLWTHKNRATMKQRQAG